MIEKGLFRWDAKKEQAALLIAQGELTNEEIADKVDIGVATLYRWKDYQEFADRVASNVVAYREATLTQQIGDIVKRIRRYNKRWMQIDELIDERAKAAIMQEVAGGKTGLLAHDIKSVGSGDSAYTIDIYRFDAALIKEERELAKQAAQECGQWQESVRAELVGKDGGPIETHTSFDLGKLDTSELEQFLSLRQKAESIGE